MTSQLRNAENIDTALAKLHGRSKTVTFIADPEPEPLFCPIISVDDHAMEPVDLFVDRVPEKYRAEAPRIERDEDGAPWWVVDGVPQPILLVNGASGRAMSEWRPVITDYDEMREGCWNPTARLADMDQAGVWASLCFCSTVWGFAGTRFSQMGDPELGYACLRAYNDWHLEAWCGAAPDRYIPCQLSYLADPVRGAEEIRRNADRGFKAVSFSENPEGLGFPNVYDRYWDPFFAACEETGTVINLHVGSSGLRQRPSSSSTTDVGVALFPVSGISAIVDWIYAGVPLRFPNLTIALSEAGLSWVPMVLERLGRAYRLSDGVGQGWPKGAPSPAEVVRRNFVFTSIEDHAGFRMLDLIGEDNVMVETDYPHFDSTWPACQAMIRSELSALAPETIRKACYENAARIYRHSLPPEEMIARSEVAALAQR